MNWYAICFLLLNSLLLLQLPRNWAILPMLVGACYMTNGQSLEVLGLNIRVLQILIAVACIRIFLRREYVQISFITTDRIILIWGGWAILASCFHEHPVEFVINTSSLVYNCTGIYFIARCFTSSVSATARVIGVLGLVLAPVALEMLYEQVSGHNLFSALGGVPETVSMRSGRFRAQGPFAHSILGGTVGAVCIPLMVGIWKRERRLAIVGLASCLLMVLTSASSGPLMSLVFALAALSMWRWRHWTRQMRIAAVLGYIALDLIMKAPAYYLIARVDLVGGSTGWHRARLIESAIKHFGEWWMVGTDYTRHWMPTGVPWSEDHTDITNQYLAMGVRGGFPLMILLICMFWKSFHYVGLMIRNVRGTPIHDRFLGWCAGASLLAHAATCISVAYFDQSFVFLYLCFALCGSLYSANPRISVRNRSARANIGRSRVQSEAVGAVRPGEPQNVGRFFTSRTLAVSAQGG